MNDLKCEVMKRDFDKFMEIYEVYKQLESEERYDEAKELSKMILQILLRAHVTVDNLREYDYSKFIRMFSESEWYETNKIVCDIISNEKYSTEYDKSCSRYEKWYKKKLKTLEKILGKKSIREYVISRNHNKLVPLDIIIADMHMVSLITEYSSAELKGIHDNWGGFVKKTVDHSIDIISLTNIRRRAKFISDILNNVEVKIEYDNGDVVFDAESALETATRLSRIEAERLKEKRREACSKGGKIGGKISSPKKAITVQYLGELDSMDEELIKNDGIYHFESKGEARVFMESYAKTTYSTKTFSKFIKGKKCKISKLWRLISVE